VWASRKSPTWKPPQISGRTNEELAAEGKLREDHKARAAAAGMSKIVLPDISKIRGAQKGLLPTFLEPSLASPCEKPPSGPKWIHEIKHDGYRMQARIDGPSIRLFTRKAIDWTNRFRSIADALGKLGLGSALIDGEVVVEDAAGISSLNNLQADLKAGRRDRLRYFLSDLLYCDGFDLTKRHCSIARICCSASSPDFLKMRQSASASILIRTDRRCSRIRADLGSKGSSPSERICPIDPAAASTGSKRNACKVRNS